MQLQRQVGLPFRNPSMKKNAANRLPLTTFRAGRASSQSWTILQSCSPTTGQQCECRNWNSTRAKHQKNPGPTQIVGTIFHWRFRIFSRSLRACMPLFMELQWGLVCVSLSRCTERNPPFSTLMIWSSIYPWYSIPTKYLMGVLNVLEMTIDTSETRGRFCGCYLLRFRLCCGVGSQLWLSNHIQWDLDIIYLPSTQLINICEFTYPYGSRAGFPPQKDGALHSMLLKFFPTNAALIVALEQ